MGINFLDATIATNYNRNEHELQLFMLFCICVAGKTAKQISKALEAFLNSESGLPFDSIKKMIEKGTLIDNMKKAKLGKYSKLPKAFNEVINSNLDLKTCSTEDLEKIYLIGFKTSRYFLLHSRPNQQIAALDRHVLDYLKNDLKIADVPKNTPSKQDAKTYYKFEKIFIDHAKSLNKDIAQLDLEIWNSKARI